jgi:superfamily II DNA or RNA helicase
MPTGSGKTIVARALVEGAAAKHKRVLFLAPRRELIFQTCEKLEAVGVSYGVLMAGQVPRRWEPVQVACVSTLTTRCLRNHSMALPAADLVIVDEAHLSIAKQTRALLDAYPGAVKVGLTATPARTDGKGLGAMYDDLVLGPSVAELTALGHLVPVRYFAPTKPDLAKIRVVRGDYDQAALGARMDDPKLVGDIVANWARIAPERKTVVFAVNVSHSMHLRDRFLEIGVTAEHLDGATPKEERAAILKRLRAGETQVLCNCEVLTYGWDEPSIACAVLARPTKSLARYFQMVGRVLRPSDGKADCIAIDHSGAVDEIGFVDEPIVWSLDASDNVNERHAKDREAKPKTITCGECATVFSARGTCPNCGAEVPKHFAKPVEVLNAELAELERDKRRKNREWSNREKRVFHGELLGVQGERGYRYGWAANQYRERFGVWPNAYKDAPVVEPTRETLAWVQSRLIRYAKRKTSPASATTAKRSLEQMLRVAI